MDHSLTLFSEVVPDISPSSLKAQELKRLVLSSNISALEGRLKELRQTVSWREVALSRGDESLWEFLMRHQLLPTPCWGDVDLSGNRHASIIIRRFERLIAVPDAQYEVVKWARFPDPELLDYYYKSRGRKPTEDDLQKLLFTAFMATNSAVFDWSLSHGAQLYPGWIAHAIFHDVEHEDAPSADALWDCTPNHSSSKLRTSILLFHFSLWPE